MQITLIRHLPTEWNQKTLLQGRKDIGLSTLTEKDRRKITENQRLLNDLSPFDFVLASTLKRTHQTANLYGFEAETESLLDELDFGSFEGLPKALLLKEYGWKWLDNPQKLVLGESLENLEARIRLFIEKYKDYDNILVFGHGSWMRAFLSYHKHGHINDMNKMTIENNSCLTRSFYSER